MKDYRRHCRYLACLKGGKEGDAFIWQHGAVEELPVSTCCS